MAELKKESEKEARVKRRLAKEIESLKEKECRSVKEKEVRRRKEEVPVFSFSGCLIACFDVNI